MDKYIGVRFPLVTSKDPLMQNFPSPYIEEVRYNGKTFVPEKAFQVSHAIYSSSKSISIDGINGKFHPGIVPSLMKGVKKVDKEKDLIVRINNEREYSFYLADLWSTLPYVDYKFGGTFDKKGHKLHGKPFYVNDKVLVEIPPFKAHPAIFKDIEDSSQYGRALAIIKKSLWDEGATIDRLLSKERKTERK